MTQRVLQLGVLFVGVVAVCMLTHQTLAASQPEEVAEGQANPLDTLEDLVGRLRTQRQDYYRQKAEDDAAILQARENAQLLRIRLDELRTQEADLDEQIRKYQSELQALTAQSAQKIDMRRAVARETAAFVARQAAEIEEGIPYKRQERIARLKAGSPDANDAASLSAAEQLGHLWSYAQEELRLAGSSETYSDRACIERDITPYARYFRVGLLILGYVTEDGRRTALWLPARQGGQWQSIPDPGQAAGVREAVKILDRRQAPGFVCLPMTTGPVTSGGKGP